MSTRKSAVMEIKQLDVERSSCCLYRAPQADFMSDISLPLPLPVPGLLTRNMWKISKNMHAFVGSIVLVSLLNLLALLLYFMCKHTQNGIINDGRLNFWLDCFVGLSWLGFFFKFMNACFAFYPHIFV